MKPKVIAILSISLLLMMTLFQNCARQTFHSSEVVNQSLTPENPSPVISCKMGTGCGLTEAQLKTIAIIFTDDISSLVEDE